MTLFASRTPRDLNRDPEPWIGRSPVTGDLIRTPVAPAGLSGFNLQPRGYYDPDQHNEPNPILVAHRMYRGAVKESGLDPVQEHLDELYWTNAGDYNTADPEHVFTYAHIEHARKVLSRLRRLANLAQNGDQS